MCEAQTSILLRVPKKMVLWINMIPGPMTADRISLLSGIKSSCQKMAKQCTEASQCDTNPNERLVRPKDAQNSKEKSNIYSTGLVC